MKDMAQYPGTTDSLNMIEINNLAYPMMYNSKNKNTCFSSLLDSSTEDFMESKILATSKIASSYSHKKAVNPLRNSFSATATSSNQKLSMR